MTYVISSLEMGGAERALARLSGALVAEYDLTVVALRGGKQTIVDELPAGVNVIDLDIKSPLEITSIGHFWGVLADTDVLVCSLYHAAVLGTFLGRLQRVPTILTWQHNQSFRSPIRAALFGLAARASDCVLADSTAVVEMLEETYGSAEIDIKKVPIAGVDTDRFAPDVGERGTERGTVVGILGRLVEQKNHDAVLTAADRLRDLPIHFEVAGDGPRRRTLETRARDLGLDVSFHGFVEDAPTFLNRLDVYVQPSHQEGLCITAVEAMACGLPVVATAVGGLSETVVDGESGFLVDAGDVDAFADRIRTLHESPIERIEMGQRARQRVVEQYSRAVLVREFRAALTMVET